MKDFSIGLTDLDCVPGTMPDIILSNTSSNNSAIQQKKEHFLHYLMTQQGKQYAWLPPQRGREPFGFSRL